MLEGGVRHSPYAGVNRKRRVLVLWGRHKMR